MGQMVFMMMRWTAMAVLGALVMLSVAVGTVSGTDHIVDDDPGAWRTHTTIQDAINDSVEGDTVLVYAGVYHENVIVNQTINLIGNGSAETIINGSYSGDAVYIDSDWVNMSHIGVTAGWSTGIYMNGDDLRVHNCSVNDTDSAGIYIKRYDSVVDNCTVSNTRWGLEIIYTQRQTVKWSHFEDNERSGIHLGGASEMTIHNNTFTKCGFYFTGNIEVHFNSQEIRDCTVGGRPVAYLAEVENETVPTGAGQVIVAGCANVTIEDQYLHNSSYGLILAYSKHLTISNCTLDDQYISAWVEEVDNSVFSNIMIDNVEDNGLYIQTSDSILIEDVNATNVWGDRPLYIASTCWNVRVVNFTSTNFWAGMVVYGDGTVIENCTSWYNSYGIYIGDDNITVRNCNIYDTQYGIYGSTVQWINITNTSIHDSSNHGIWFQNVENSTIAYNEIFGNSGYGIRLQGTGTWNNVIHHNNFADNGGGHVETESSHDTYDDGVSEGNYWDDWDGNGTYEVDGGMGEDRYPLSDPADTDAPEKVPEFGLMMALASVIAMLVVMRRRR